MRINIPKPSSAGFILSYKCNASCRHCMYACTPKWPADWITENDLKSLLSQLARTIEPSPYGPEFVSLSHGLHFTGGEPFLNFKLLSLAVEAATDYGIPSTFVETNCYWCSDDEMTREKLLLLKSKGLKGIMISVNPFYLEYVPFERTERCVKISSEIFGQNAMVYQWEYFNRFKRLGIKNRMPLEEYLKRDSWDNFFREVEFFMMGKAAYHLGDELFRYFPKYTSEVLCREPCWPPFLRDWHNHIDNYGNYMPGFCGGISLGDCHRLDELLKDGLELKNYPILGYIVQADFDGLLQLAQEHGYLPNSDGYYSKCHLCVDLRKYMVKIDKFKELQPTEFYHHLDEIV